MSMKKFISLTSAAIAATAMMAQAQVSVDVVNAYVFRAGTINDDVNVQPGFETGIFGGAATVGTWANLNTDSSQIDEIDYYVDIPLPLGEDCPVNASIGYTEYTYPGAAGEADREPYLSLGADIADGVSASLLLAYGIDGAIDSSLYGEAGLSTTVPVSDDCGLDLGCNLHYSNPDMGESGISAYSVSAGTEIAGIAVGVTYFIEADDDVLKIDEDVVVSAGYSF